MQPFTNLRSGSSDQLFSYIQKLFSRAVPVPSIIYPNDQCLVWVRALDKDGYSRHRVPKGLKGSDLVHRFIYQNLFEDPQDLTIDHACGKKSCINPRHMRVLPLKMNRELGYHRNLVMS